MAALLAALWANCGIAATDATEPAYRDPTLPVEARVADLLGRMTVEEKVGQLNVGDRSGAEVVQLYVRDVISSVTTPVKQLKGLARVTLSPGESRTVRFVLKPDDLALENRQMHRVVEPGDFQVMIGHSSADIRLTGQFEVVE